MAAITTQEDLPPLRGPYTDEDWVGYRSGPGHTGVVGGGPTVDSDDPGCEPFYDGAFVGEPVVADGSVYLADGDGRIVAIDAQDGTTEWTSDDVGVTGTPALANHRIVASGDGKLIALDVEDGTVDWETEFDASMPRLAAAYQTVFVVAGETLYALDVEDGSTEWKRSDETFFNRPAVSRDQVYVIVGNQDSAGDQDLVALDVATGEERWRTEPRWYAEYGIVASDDYVSVAAGLDDRNIFDATSGEKVRNSAGESTPAHDDEIFSYRTDYRLKTWFFDDREGWDFFGGSLSLSPPTVAGDTLYVYYGRTMDEDMKQYEYSLLAFDKYDGAVKWTCETLEVDEPYDLPVVATGDAVYVVGDEEIHVVHEDDATDEDDSTDDEDDSSEEDDSTDGDDSTDEDDASDGDDSTDEGDSSTPEDTPTPEESTDDDCGCPKESSSDDGTSAGGDDTPTDEGTATDEGTSSGESTKSTDEDHQPVENGTSTEETDSAGPGLGVVTAISSLGGIGYVLRRRLRSGKSEEEH